MAITAWKLPGTVVAPGWTNPNNIKAKDTNLASKSVGSGGYSGVIRGENFGFTTDDIPAGSTIDGIEAEAVLMNTGTAVPNAYSLYLQKVGGTNVGNNKASSWNFPTDASMPTRIAGGATDKWGVNPTAAEAIASTFAVAYEFNNGDPKFSTTGNIDSFRLRFHYTPPAAPTVTANSASAIAGVGGTVQMSATNSPTSWSLPGSPPTGVSVNSSGLVTWTGATPAGVHSITVRATNAGGFGDGTLTLTIASATRPRRPGFSRGMRCGL